MPGLWVLTVSVVVGALGGVAAYLAWLTNAHHSKRIHEELGPNVVEEMEMLLINLRYMTNELTEASEKAAASKSAISQHDRMNELAEELQKEIHR